MKYRHETYQKKEKKVQSAATQSGCNNPKTLLLNIE